MFNKSFKTNIKSNEYFDEAIIKSQPHGNLYNIIEPIQQCNFPYCLVGKLKIFFKITSTLWKRSECVGTIIGPDVILTTAHSLTYEHTFDDKSKKYLKPERIIFLPSVNGEFNPFRPVEHLSLIVSEKYSKIVKNEDRKSCNSDFDEELLDDYGLIILNRSIGDEIIKLYQLDHLEELNLIPFRTIDKEEIFLYDYFVKANENFNKLEKNAFLPNISLISYTKYKEEYLNSSYYPYSSSFKVIKKRIIKKEEEFLKKYLNSSSENSLSNTFEKENNDINKTNVKNDKNVTQVQKNLLICNNHHGKTRSIQLSNNKNSNLSSTQTDIRFSINKQSNLFQNEQTFNKNGSYRINEVDTIIFDEEFSSMFFSEGNRILCEAKGVIDNNLFSKEIPDNNLVIRYRLTTFSGQSGSPIFLRIKEKKLENEKANSKNLPRTEKYYFVGIHCQRPKNRLIRIKSLNEQNDTLLNEINDCTNENRSTRAERDMNCSLLETGFSDYNIGLKIDDTIVKNIVQNVLKEKCNLSFFFKKNSRKINYLKSLKKNFDSLLEENSSYVPIRLYVADKIILQGVIHQERNLEQLYLVGERLFKDIPIKFISLLYKKQKMDYENFFMKKVKELKKIMNIYFKKVKNGIVPDEDDPVYEFEILVNFKEYSNYLANNIFLKLEHSSFRLIKTKDEVNSSCLIDERKHPHLELDDNHKEVCINKLKVVHSSIIERINYLSEYPFIFGTLYNSIKDRLLERYHIY